MSPNHLTRVFSKWLSLKSANSMSHGKVQTGLVTKGSTYLATDTLPIIVILRIFPLIPLVTYLLPLTTLNIYLTRDSNGNFFFTTTWRNISVVRYGVSLVTILLLDFFLIHRIQWILWKLFRENSIKGIMLSHQQPIIFRQYVQSIPVKKLTMCSLCYCHMVDLLTKIIGHNLSLDWKTQMSHKDIRKVKFVK